MNEGAAGALLPGQFTTRCRYTAASLLYLNGRIVGRQTSAPNLRAGRSKTYGPPVCKRFLRSNLSSLRQRIRPEGNALAKMEIRASRSS
jgi:hypothetical protein